MTEKELLEQLNKLKNIKPDSRWKKGGREILFAQIYSGEDTSEVEEKVKKKDTFFYYLRNCFPREVVGHLAQPAWTVALIIIFVLGGGTMSIKAARDTKPGDSLYIAKVISEKTQLVLTFSEKEKTKLSIEFAGNRAKEITQVMSESSNGEKQGRVEKLTINFKKEIDAAKTRLQKMTAVNLDNKEGGQEGIVEKENSENDFQVFGANLGKDNNGMQISGTSAPTAGGEEAAGAEEVLAPAEVSTSTPSVNTEDGDSSSLEETLREAGQLFADEDYGATLSKLDEASEIINNVGENNEEDNTATTTEDNLEEVDVLGVSEEADDTEDTIDSATTTEN